MVHFCKHVYSKFVRKRLVQLNRKSAQQMAIFPEFCHFPLCRQRLFAVTWILQAQPKEVACKLYGWTSQAQSNQAHQSLPLTANQNFRADSGENQAAACCFCLLLDLRDFASFCTSCTTSGGAASPSAFCRTFLFCSTQIRHGQSIPLQCGWIAF